MVEKKIPGTIINITSNHQQGNWPAASVYGPVKAALNKFTENAALELAPYGIRVVSVAPGYTDTWGFSSLSDSDIAQGRGQRAREIVRRIPLGRMCETREVGKACVFLAGEGAGYITGTCLYMDGGALLPVITENRYS